jgi:3-phosphoshikimate 1-carboxyvinyltransferase
MKVRIIPTSEIKGSVKAPSSKSFTHRAYFIALLTNGISEIIDPLKCSDTLATVKAVKAFGASVKGNFVKGVSYPKIPENIINCSGSGTTLRFATAVGSIVDGTTILTGSRSLRKRPLGSVEVFNSLGARLTSRNSFPPVVIEGGRINRRHVIVDGSLSSQIVSGLLIVAPKIGLTLEVENLKSRPYVDMTIKVMEAFGGKVMMMTDHLFDVTGIPYKPTSFKIPGDYSSASFLMAAGALLGKVRVTNLDHDDVQADRKFIKVLKAMGATVIEEEKYVEVMKNSLSAIEFDATDCPDLVPIVSVLASCARGLTTIKNIGRLISKESNRIISISENLKKMGAEVTLQGESLLIKGKDRLKGAILNSYDDHRIAMAFTVAALAADGQSLLVDAQSVRKSYPDFFSHIAALGGNVAVT